MADSNLLQSITFSIQSFDNLKCLDTSFTTLLGEVKRDSEGTELLDLCAVKSEGVLAAKELVSSALRAGTTLQSALGRTFEIEDGAGKIVMRIPFAAAVDPNNHPH